MATRWLLRVEALVRAYLARRQQAGQGLVEYALILSFVAIFVVVALKYLQPVISTTLNLVSNGL